MAMNYYDKFVAKLQEIFMMDHAELDFGIYRIMNQKRDEIQHFLQVDLLPQVKTALQGDGGNTQQAKQRMAEIEQMFAGMDIETLPDSNPNVAEYKKLKAQLAQGGNAADMEGEVFSHLVTFFSRYYDGGDFLSKRRYKDNTYAIPYNGEEVKLHWANSDQYYIKTSEYFRNYTFVLPTSRKKVHFVLKDASTEQNNNRAANNMERRFALWEPENEGDQVIEVTPEDDLNIYFTYELMPKATKQKDLLAAALETITPLVPADFEEVLTAKAPIKDNPNRTLLEKHLTDYTAKNSFDYFIHKDLGGFLSRELDFYIKNEVLYIDDLDPQHINSQLSIVKAIKQVGQKIIQMLAQLENFQKKLWLKKKFVVQSDYCITLDRVPEKLYPEIIANEAQRKEWVRLFAIDEIQGDMMTKAYSEPLTIEFLKQNPFLVLDTAFFDAKFKHQLVKGMENIDEQTNGLLIKSENFQALRLLQEKYRRAISCIYIDPPFNLKQNGDFLYRTDYKDSTWCSLLQNRLNESTSFFSENAFFYLRCDNNGNHLVRHIMNDVFGEDKFLSEVLVQRIRKNVTDQGRISLPLANDSLFLYTNTDSYVFNNPYVKLKEIREAYWRRVDDSSGFRNPPTRILFGKEFKPYKYDAHFKYSQESMDKMVLEGRMRIICKNCGEPHYKGIWDKCPKCGCTEATPQYRVEATDKIILDTNWLDIAGYSSKTGFSTENAEVLLERALEVCSAPNDIVMDYFGGSGTTMAVAAKKGRKYIGVEMGEQFEVYIEPRMRQVCYSGISQCFKYIRLEQYEDTLNNLEIKKQQTDWRDDEFHESYMLNYLLDTETRDSLLNLKWFENPFEMTLKTTKDNELVETKVDMVETFNYLIGLNVETEDWYQNENICVVQGRTHREGLKTLVIWRNCKAVDSGALNAFFDKMDFRTRDTEFDLIYVNGDNTLPNLMRDEDHWKVVLTEEEFAKRMFEEN